MPRFVMDITALRTSAAFRRMFAAQLVSNIGTQITLAALLYQVYVVSGRSSLKVGFVGLAEVLPTVVLALLGGAIADAVDRRRLLQVVQVGMFASSASLAWLATLHAPPLWALYALAAVSASFAAVDGPTRSAVIPMLVDAETLASAVQLREVLTQSGRTFGPVIGGVLIASGLRWAYATDAATFVFALVLFLGLPKLHPATRTRVSLASIFESVSFTRARPVLAMTFVADLFAMILGMPRAVFPAMARDVFHVGGVGYGLLMAAPAAGALLGLLVLGGLISRVRREGMAVLLSVAVWGCATAAFGIAPRFWLGLVLLAVAGAGDMVSAVFRQLMLLQIVPDELRGRLSAVHIMVVTGGPRIGDLEAGGAAAAVGVRTSVVLGGLGCVAGMGLIAARVPAFARWVGARDGLDAMEPA
jgi:MFS family permease